MAAAADELVLLERVFLRIGSAETDDQLQNAITKFLPPVLLKLSSQQEGVRKKVMELLVHINKRVKSRPLVQLPVDALLLQYQDPSASSFVTNFTIIYIKLGFPRLPIIKQAELVPSVLNSLEGKPQSHQDSLLMLIIPLLGEVKVPDDPAKRSSLFGLNEKLHVSKHLLELMLDMLLLPYGSISQPSQSSEPGAEVSFPVPPGMSQYTYKRVTAENPLKPEELEKVKLGIVKFLASGVFNDSDILIQLIIAAADTRFSVANLADLELKKIVGSLDWSSTSLAMQLYKLYLGKSAAAPSSQQSKPEHVKTPANTRIRLKLLQYLCKLTGAGLIVPACVQVVFDSLYGTNTNSRLKSLALTFTTNIVQYADMKDFTAIGNLLLCGMTKLTDEGEPIHQGQAYVIIGLIGRRLPSLVSNDLNLLEKLFKKLASSNTDIKLQIREGMLNLVSGYKYSEGRDEDPNLNNSKIVLLHSLLSQYLDNEEPMVRFVAVRFLASVFPSNHVKSRYLLLKATGDSKDDVVSEALKSLYGSAYKQDMNTDPNEKEKTKFALPSFNEMMTYVNTEVENLLKKPQKCYTQGNHVLPFTVPVYKEFIIYLRLCLVQNVDIPPSRNLIKHPTEVTPLLSKYVANLYQENEKSETNPVIYYLQFVKKLLRANAGIETIGCMLELIGCLPVLHSYLASEITWIKDLLNSTKEEIRESASTLYGILVAHSQNDDQFQDTINDLKRATVNDKYPEIQHGSILGIANAIERRITIKKVNFENINAWETYKTSLSTLCNYLKHQNNMILSAGCTAIGLLGRCAPLCLEADSTIQNKNSEINSKLGIVKRLLEIMNNVKLPSKVRERAARTLGLICVGEIFPYTKEVLEGLLKTAKDTKDVEVHFTIGESLVMTVQSIWSPEARDAWTTLPEDYHPSNTMIENPPDEDLTWLVGELLKYASQPHPNARQAACIWLLTLLKNCSQRQPIKEKLTEFQVVFMDMLSENNDIVVDVASKGLSLVFDSSDSTLASALLEQLVNQLQSGRKSVAQVTSDTKLFEEGELGTAPTGGNLSTYKELCSLASDLNKPDLIYKFMQIANHNTIWNSKKGAAFGFVTIASKAGEQLKPHLPKIIPRLYRYQFDPTPNLQNSMQRIWHALVPETQKTIDEYHKEILTDLVTNLIANQWRVRQSCCLALQDFLRGGNRSLHDMVDSICQLWTQLFRVMDDVHEGTRVAATNTTKLLSKLSIRACDSEYGKNGSRMVEAILPVLLQTGITNTVSEVRAISLNTVSQLVGAAGGLLKPHLPLLIPALLQATGELESAKLSYLSTMFGSQAQTQEIIDSARASAAKSHYTTETMGRCLQYVDSSILEELVPRVLDLMKSTVGLGTRVACAHFINLLTLQLGQELQPYSGKFLAALVNGLTDRNAAVRKHNASAIGHLVRTCKDSSIEKLFTKLKTWYFEKEDNSIRSSVGYVIQSIGTHNQDTLKAHSDVVLPLVFFAMHAEKTEDTKSTVEMFAEIWTENSPGTETGVKQNIEGLCDILKTAFDSSSWTMKAQAANSVSTIATKLGSSLETKHRNLLLQILISGLSGRTWNGKEKLLDALGSICLNCKDSIKNDTEIPLDIIIDAVMKECRKENIVYRRHAIEAIGNILSALEVDRFEELYNIVQDILMKHTSDLGSDEEDMTAEETSKKQETLISLRETIYESLGKAWPLNEETQVKFGELLVEHCASCLSTTTRSIQVSVMSALYQYVDKLAILKQDSVSPKYIEIFPKIIQNVYKAIFYALSISKHTKLRKEALNIVFTLAKKYKEKNRIDDFQELNNKFIELLSNLETDKQPEIRSRVIDIKTIFNIH